MNNIYSENKNDLFCKFCEKQCKNLNSLHQHEIRCRLNPNRLLVGKKATEFISCKFCNKTYAKGNGISRHENYCKLNPNRKIQGPAWNKGLTADTDERVARCVTNMKKYYETHDGHQKGKPRTTEEKEKISTAMKSNPSAGGYRQGSGIGKKGWYKGFFCDSTYELVYIIYNIDHDIEFSRFTGYYEYDYKGEHHKYYPDFILGDGSLVEIKGYFTEQVQAKLNSVDDKPIKLLMESDLKYAFDYVKDNYNYITLEDLYER